MQNLVIITENIKAEKQKKIMKGAMKKKSKIIKKFLEHVVSEEAKCNQRKEYCRIQDNMNKKEKNIEGI